MSHPNLLGVSKSQRTFQGQKVILHLLLEYRNLEGGMRTYFSLYPMTSIDC